MGRDLFENFTAAREVFEQADEALGFSISELCFSGDEAELQLTANTQPAILTVSTAALRAMESAGLPSPELVAGHSLGEFSALVAAGVLDFADAVRTVRKRGTYMQDAVPLGVGAMAAILGADMETVTAACEEVSIDEICSPANINSPAQVVIAGHAAAVDRACELLKARGARRAVRLNVSAPFHCALMMPAQERLEVDLHKLEYGIFNVPVVHNVDAEINTESEKVPGKLTEQVSSPVKWLECVNRMISEGVTTFIEVGPGKVLTGMMRQIDRNLRALNVEDSNSLAITQATL